MSELKRWLDESSEADDFERAILRAGLEADPPPAKRDQIWSVLTASLAVAPLAAVTTSTSAAGAPAAGAPAVAVASKAGAVWLAVAKGFLVGLAIYGTTAGVIEISDRLSAHQAPAATAPQAALPRRAASSAAQPSAAASPLLLTPTSENAPTPPHETPRGTANAKAIAREPLNPSPDLPSVAAFDDPTLSSSARASQLEAETRALRLARDELRAGKLADAFATLEASRRQFSAPELYQEREALMIELLSRSGQMAAAKQRAQAFLSRFPESPHAQQVRSLSSK